MKKFAGTKPLFQIKQQCAAAGVAFDDYNFRKHGADYVALGIAELGSRRPDGSPIVNTASSSTGGWVMFNAINGKFFGETPRKRTWHHPLVNEFCPPSGIRFSSSDTKHEHEPWFQALLAFFYVERDDALPRSAAKQIATTEFSLGVLGGTGLRRNA